MKHPFTDINEFILTEIQKVRRWTVQPGPQYADDPQRLRDVALRALQQYGVTDLTPQQRQRLYDCFAQEAQEFRRQYHQYIAHDAYKDILADIKSILERIKPVA
jgi:uncharacterized protein YpuA (DUF1002 family)